MARFADAFHEVGQAVRGTFGLPGHSSPRNASDLGATSHRNRNANDEDEDARLHLVALACEVVVLAALIEQDLVFADGRADADEIRHACAQHRSAADLQLLLQPGPREDHALAAQSAKINVFNTRLEDLRQLRDCTAGLRPRKALPRGRTGWPLKRL